MFSWCPTCLGEKRDQEEQHEWTWTPAGQGLLASDGDAGGSKKGKEKRRRIEEGRRKREEHVDTSVLLPGVFSAAKGRFSLTSGREEPQREGNGKSLCWKFAGCAGWVWSRVTRAQPPAAGTAGAARKQPSAILPRAVGARAGSYRRDTR